MRTASQGVSFALYTFLFLNTIHPNNDFTTRLMDLFKNYPNVDPNALGMKPDWENEPLWQ
ncbi:hypothetical protein V8G61_04675 [Gaetbulibacter sp. M240]|uniref:hypothetical protein n=1 Tax=Gaetbulibacter sp. M240 TaxID=3126511 RepID=UPI00374FC1C0